jgi:ankyrin repeat protein
MKRRRALLFSLTVVLALCAACGWWLHRERQQYALNRQLIAALLHNDTKTALALVNEGADPNTRYGPPPAPSLKLLINHLLHHALPANTTDTAFIIACGSLVQMQHPYSWRQQKFPSPLHEDVPLVQSMLAHSANVRTPGHSKLTALHTAVFSNHIRTAELLLQKGAKVDAQDEYGRTALVFASASPTADMVRLLLAHHATVNMLDEQGCTPLYYAVASLNENNVIPELLAYGADPNAKGKDGITPLIKAQQMNRAGLARLLRRSTK